MVVTEGTIMLYSTVAFIAIFTEIELAAVIVIEGFICSGNKEKKTGMKTRVERRPVDGYYIPGATLTAIGKFYRS